LAPNLATWRHLLPTPLLWIWLEACGNFEKPERYIKEPVSSGRRQFSPGFCDGRTCVKRCRFALERFAKRLPSFIAIRCKSDAFGVLIKCYCFRLSQSLFNLWTLRENFATIYSRSIKDHAFFFSIITHLDHELYERFVFQVDYVHKTLIIAFLQLTLIFTLAQYKHIEIKIWNFLQFIKAVEILK